MRKRTLPADMTKLPARYWLVGYLEAAIVSFSVRRWLWLEGSVMQYHDDHVTSDLVM